MAEHHEKIQVVVPDGEDWPQDVEWEPGVGGFDFPTDFDPSIFASTMDFGGYMSPMNRAERSKYLAQHGREAEAFERDE